MSGDVSGAREVLKRAFAAGHNSESVWLAAIKLEWESGELSRARLLLGKARERAGTARVWMKSCLFERETGDADAERKLISESLERYPEFEKLWMMAGQAAERRGDAAEARRQYQLGLGRCPESINLLDTCSSAGRVWLSA